MSRPMPFQQFQRDFALHLRDPRSAPRPAGVPARPLAIYKELLYNNVEGCLAACLPVTRQLLGDRRWPRLVRAFGREARCHSPYFRDIPREFLDWLKLAQQSQLPPWLWELAHYEWVELALDVMETTTPPHDTAGDLLEGVPVLAPALMNLAYAWPVQRIRPEWRPRKPVATHLLVFRDPRDRVQFVELNLVSARLVTLVQAGASGRVACQAIGAELGHAQPEALVAHGGALLADLAALGAILGTRP